MNFNYKLFFKYILFNTNQLFFKYLIRNDKNTNVIILQKNLYYTVIHLRLSSLFYSTQLVDMFAYELPINLNLKKNFKISNTNNCIVVYNFHSINFQQRFFIFTINNQNINLNKNLINQANLNSITELFPNANWLERENSEMHGIFFSKKKDLRNLMLQYGDTSAPFLKSYPSIGTKEIFYDSANDLLIQNPVTIQF